MRLLSAIALTLSVFVLAACGDDNDDTTSTTSETATTEESIGTTGETGATGEGGAAERCPGADSPPNITNVTAYGVECADVEDEMSKVGSISTKFTLGDFECELASGAELSGSWRCDGDDGYFTFDFGD